MPAIPTPLCDVCQKPVENFQSEYLPGIGVKMTAKCHGETEILALSSREFMALKDGIVDARAFRVSGPRITVREAEREGVNDPK